MFPKLMYSILVIIISLAAPGASSTRIDFFMENTLAGKYQITRDNNTWSFIIEDGQFTLPFFSAIRLPARSASFQGAISRTTSPRARIPMNRYRIERRFCISACISSSPDHLDDNARYRHKQ